MGKKCRQYDLIETKAYFSKRSKSDGFVIDTNGHLLFVRCLNNVIRWSISIPGQLSQLVPSPTERTALHAIPSKI
jgi:hypothetical protein